MIFLSRNKELPTKSDHGYGEEWTESCTVVLSRAAAASLRSVYHTYENLVFLEFVRFLRNKSLK
jgi:hypothetical protein